MVLHDLRGGLRGEERRGGRTERRVWGGNNGANMHSERNGNGVQRPPIHFPSVCPRVHPSCHPTRAGGQTVNPPQSTFSSHPTPPTLLPLPHLSDWDQVLVVVRGLPVRQLRVVSLLSGLGPICVEEVWMCENRESHTAKASCPAPTPPPPHSARRPAQHHCPSCIPHVPPLLSRIAKGPRPGPRVEPTCLGLHQRPCREAYLLQVLVREPGGRLGGEGVL